MTGLQVNSERWYEAKYHLVGVLAKLDPPHAREVIDQHRQLNPTYGPPPWDEKFGELDKQIPLAEGPIEREPDGSGVGS